MAVWSSVSAVFTPSLQSIQGLDGLNHPNGFTPFLRRQIKPIS